MSRKEMVTIGITALVAVLLASYLAPGLFNFAAKKPGLFGGGVRIPDVSGVPV